MASRRLFDGATIEIGQLPIVAAALPPAAVTLWIRDSGVWKTAVLWVKASGTWKVATLNVKDAGTWKS